MTEEEIKHFKEYVRASFYWSLFPKYESNSRNALVNRLSIYRSYFKKQLDLFSEYGLVVRDFRGPIDALIKEFDQKCRALEASIPEEVKVAKKTGSPRCPREAATEIVRAIEKMKNNRPSREWLREFLLPGGELDEFLEQFPERLKYLDFEIPRPSTGEDKDWALQMSDRLLRGLMVGENEPAVRIWSDELKIKRDAFLNQLKSEPMPPLFYI